MRMPAQDDLDPLDFLREHSICPVPDMRKDDNEIRFIFEFLNLFLDGVGGRQKSNTRYVAGVGSHRGLLGNDPDDSNSVPAGKARAVLVIQPLLW
jgi:hypothetical protein